MSDEKIVRVEVSQDNAILLLAEAEKAEGGDVSVVRTTSFGWFEVPESVAKAAGVDVIPDEGVEDEDSGLVNPDKHTKEGLQQMAEDRGLPTSGTKAELAAAINEFDSKEV